MVNVGGKIPVTIIKYQLTIYQLFNLHVLIYRSKWSVGSYRKALTINTRPGFQVYPGENGEISSFGLEGMRIGQTL